MAVRDDVLSNLEPTPEVPAPAMSAPVAAEPAPAPEVAPSTAPADPAAAEALFSNYADEQPAAAAPVVEPRRVQTQTIRPDAGPLTSAIARNSALMPRQLSTAQDTAGRILEATGAGGVTNLNQAAYILATARRESLMGNLMTEGGSERYFEGRYGHRTEKGQELGNTEPGDGARYRGRGLVQITGRTNYTMWNNRLRREGVQHDGEDVDLVNNPTQATDPAIASQILVEGMRDGTFTRRHRLDQYINDNRTDYLGARRIVNGTDHREEIAAQARTYQRLLEQNSGEYANAVIKGQTARLPTAQEGELSGTPHAPGDEMLSPTPIGGTPGGFVKPHQLLRRNLGRFTPAAAPQNLTILNTQREQE